jgi:hypothetical protein
VPGLDPGIHGFLFGCAKTWMAGSSPAMTKVHSVKDDSNGSSSLNLALCCADQGRNVHFVNGGEMPITLQSTVGGFSPEFMRRLPALEQAMIAHGLEPSEFVISKDRATPVSVPFIGPFFYDYTVFVGGENFTVTEPNDMVFLDYFTKRCIAADSIRPRIPFLLPLREKVARTGSAPDEGRYREQ